MDWKLAETNAELLRFFKNVIAFRHAHPALRRHRFFEYRDIRGTGVEDITFHGLQPFAPDYSLGSRCFAFMLSGPNATEPDDDIYVAMNMYWGALPFRMPKSSTAAPWKVVINTSMPSPHDIFNSGEGPTVDHDEIIVGPRSIVVLTAETRSFEGEK
jgi:glycogen operon protein